LVEMICALTTGRAEYADVEAVARQAGAAAADLRSALLVAADDDAAAYEAVVMARKLPRGTDDEKAARATAVAEATVGATEVPLRIARLSSEVLELAASMAALGNARAVSDAGVAALLAAAALRGAALNVMINVPYLPDGHPLASEAPARVEELQAAAARSKQVGDEEMSADIRWIRSYAVHEVAGGLGTFCIYQASSPEKIREHATRAGLPATDILEVAETEPGVKGDTVSNVTKPATLETGAVVQVPLFVNPGEKIKVDTAEGKYMERA